MLEVAEVVETIFAAAEAVFEVVADAATQDSVHLELIDVVVVDSALVLAACPGRDPASSAAVE